MTTRIVHAVIGLLVLGLTNPCAAGDTLPPNVTARYTMQVGGITAGHTTWTITRADNGNVTYTSRSEPVAPYSWIRSDVIERTSTLTDIAGELIPQHYRYTRTKGKRDRHVDVTFKWAASQALMDVDGQKSTAGVTTGTMDPLSYLLRVMRDVAKGDTVFEYPVAGKGRVETYKLVLEKFEELDSAVGKRTVARIKRLGQKKRQTTFWLAPSIGHLPLQIQHTEEEGSTVTFRLSDLAGIKP